MSRKEDPIDIIISHGLDEDLVTDLQNLLRVFEIRSEKIKDLPETYPNQTEKVKKHLLASKAVIVLATFDPQSPTSGKTRENVNLEIQTLQEYRKDGKFVVLIEERKGKSVKLASNLNSIPSISFNRENITPAYTRLLTTLKEWDIINPIFKLEPLAEVHHSKPKVPLNRGKKTVIKISTKSNDDQNIINDPRILNIILKGWDLWDNRAKQLIQAIPSAVHDERETCVKILVEAFFWEVYKIMVVVNTGAELTDADEDRIKTGKGERFRVKHRVTQDEIISICEKHHKGAVNAISGIIDMVSTTQKRFMGSQHEVNPKYKILSKQYKEKENEISAKYKTNAEVKNNKLFDLVMEYKQIIDNIETSEN